MKIKNLLGKKVTILGKAVPATILALVLLGGLGSAALVGYLSNMVKATVSVDSPMEQWISEDGSTYTKDDLTFTQTYGGGSVTFFIKTVNNANFEVTGNGENMVTVPEGETLTCADFEFVEVRTSSDNGATWDGPYDLIGLGLCDDLNETTIQFSYGPTPITWSALQVDINEMIVTFKTDAVGTYTFTSQIIPV